MLQRTQASQVDRIHRHFLERFPTLTAAADADPKEIKDIFSHLGLSKRVPYFIKLLRIIKGKCDSKIPSDLKELMELPQIGRYTASAVLCFGYGCDVPMVDANVIRVFQRVFGLESSKKRPRDDPKFWEFAAQLVPKGKGRRYNEALLDLGALICKTEPLCAECPLTKVCIYYGIVRALSKRRVQSERQRTRATDKREKGALTPRS